MTSSRPEPENDAPAASVRPGQAQQSSWDGDQNKSHHWTQPSRTKSAFLLTRALTVNYEEDENAVTTQPSRDPLETSIRSLPPSAPPPADRWNNGLNSEGDEYSSLAAATGPVGNSLEDISPMATPTSSMFNLRDISLLTNHRELLNNSRGRGTSLERTDKEKRVEDSPKGTYSTNPGDTALAPSPGTLSPATLDSNNPPTEGPRAQYRSWRDARPNIASGKAWSIGERGSDDSLGQVEKSITEAMTGVEPNNRSRKASHSLRFFKEGLPEDKSRRREAKSRGRSNEGSSRGKTAVGSETMNKMAGQEAHAQDLLDSQKSDHSIDRQSPFQSPVERSSSTHIIRRTSHDPNPTVGLATEEGYFDVSHNIETVSEEQVRTMPAQLLAEIRKHHNLTPGAAKGSSFSRSIPVTASERPKLDVIVQGPKLPETVAGEDENNDDGAELSNIKSTDDEDESGEEQISSALFVPHHTPHEPPERARDGLESITRPRLNDQRLEASHSQQWLEEHTVPSHEVDKKYFSQEAKSRPLPSPTHSKQKSPYAETEGFFPVHETPKTNQETTDDEGYTTTGEESSVAESLDPTPAGSVKVSGQIRGSYGQHVHDHPHDPKQPLEAIELIPYRHQVGGHTTMWRFSKRAVCKQLNNRENEFYEKVERYHPQLLKFLPRYIGVLNVTFEKQVRRKSTRKDGADAGTEQQDVARDDAEDQAKERFPDFPIVNGHASADSQPDQTRVVSQSLYSSSVPIPTVTFADNRHIIPKSFMQPHPHLIDAQHRTKSDSAATAETHLELSQAQKPSPNSGVEYRPTLSDKHAASWGATTVNKQLRNQVFGEAFLQQPIPIQRHKKPASQHRYSPARHGGSSLRTSNSESSLKAAQQSQVATSTQPVEESIRRKALKTAAEQRNRLMPLTSSELVLNEGETNDDDGEADFDDKAGTSAPEPEIARSPKGKRQRRYSSGSLRRKPEEVADDRGNLKYFEDADDAGYKGDVEEDVFAMDPEPSRKATLLSQSADEDERPLLGSTNNEKVVTIVGVSNATRLGSMLPAAPDEQSNILDIPLPVNPKEAQTQPDSRVEYFLLLEDLTAGMKRPCIMDLKMGTRQYGVDANEKKQKSQQKKCEATTSKELGVRVCGLQVWDIKTQSYIFQDKYFGRDLKVGQEFRDALTRFLYDGVDYSSVLRHIPTIVSKLSKLEILIRSLVGYRFYAASLLMFYDGDTQEEGESDSTTTEKDLRTKNEIDFKIADFANCVTRENFRSDDKPCPPRHPELPDKGFLRGLRSLKSYFLAIQKEIRTKEMGKSKKELRNGHGGAGMAESTDEDERGISY